MKTCYVGQDVDMHLEFDLLVVSGNSCRNQFAIRPSPVFAQTAPSELLMKSAA